MKAWRTYGYGNMQFEDVSFIVWFERRDELAPRYLLRPL
jgi:hypothetical protein